MPEEEPAIGQAKKLLWAGIGNRQGNTLAWNGQMMCNIHIQKAILSYLMISIPSKNLPFWLTFRSRTIASRKTAFTIIDSKTIMFDHEMSLVLIKIIAYCRKNLMKHHLGQSAGVGVISWTMVTWKNAQVSDICDLAMSKGVLRNFCTKGADSWLMRNWSQRYNGL